MKKRATLSLVLGAVLAVSACGALTACGNEDQPIAPESDVLLSFVATDGTNWDTSVTFESKKFNLALDLKNDKSLRLAGVCSGEVQSGGPGGPGGMPFSVQSDDAASADSDDEANIDYSAYNFTLGGTWTEEKGWGYTLAFDDGNNTRIAVNYDKISGRHYFYYDMMPEIDGKKASKTQVKFEAKDAEYRKTLDANYVVYEERNAVYMFCGGQEGGSGNLSMAYVYLLNNGGVVSRSGTSNSLSYSSNGSWTEDKVEHIITADVNGKECVTDAYCDIAGKEGYRMQFVGASSGPGGGSAMTLYASCDTSKFTWDKYIDSDFEGDVAEVWTGVDSDSGETYELRFTSKGFAKIFNAIGSAIKTAKYTKDGDVYKVDTAVSENGTIIISWQVAAPNPFTPAQNYNIVFTAPTN